MFRDLKSGLVFIVAQYHFIGHGRYAGNIQDRMIGMGWRDNKYGDRLTLDAEGKEVRVPAGTGPFESMVTSPNTFMPRVVRPAGMPPELNCWTAAPAPTMRLVEVVVMLLLVAGVLLPEFPIELSTVTAALEKPVYSTTRTSASDSAFTKFTVTVGVVVVATEMLVA